MKKTIICPSCGMEFEIEDDDDYSICPDCGNEVV